MSVREARALGAQVGRRLVSDDMSDQDWLNLSQYGNDPYFAAAVADSCPPGKLAATANNLSERYKQHAAGSGTEYNSYVVNGGVESMADWLAGGDAQYQRRLELLGVALGAATRSGGLDLGYEAELADVFKERGPLPAAMSVVLSYGAYGPEFAESVAESVCGYERGDGFTSWLEQSGGDVAGGFRMPDGRQRTDAMAGVMAMLGHTPEV
jgi:hypothetical protein